ncbi:hypothetical protein [Shewanella hanedai]|uniref:Uncharacterized protein n=1 Tax=Shewanella hanedai TaxID=25 RepID=A0A553JAF4_SHEHA|nr:hypothetical protein [Shewanella hanedai]TRY09410.1 hypothetical protein FN961_25680 [Shewanella hanedai]
MRVISIFIVFLLSASVLAGGSYFPIHITEFENDGDEFKLSATVSDERKWMEKECKKISVTGEYDTLKWITHKNPMNKSTHMEAVDYLSKSLKTKEKIYFGYIGSGLHKVARCTYVSKGLIFSNYDKTYVMSVHGSI